MYNTLNNIYIFILIYRIKGKPRNNILSNVKPLLLYVYKQ